MDNLKCPLPDGWRVDLTPSGVIMMVDGATVAHKMHAHWGGPGAIRKERWEVEASLTRDAKAAVADICAAYDAWLVAVREKNVRELSDRIVADAARVKAQ